MTLVLSRRNYWPSWVIAVLVFLVILGGVRADELDASTGTPISQEAMEGHSSPSFVLYPDGQEDGDYIDIEIEPGTSQQVSVILGNSGTEAIALDTFVADAIPVPNGGFGVADQEAVQSVFVSWIDYPFERVQMDPGEGIRRTLSISVPSDAVPGQYIAGLILETSETIEIPGSELFDQVLRRAMPIFLTVPGPQHPAFSLGEPEMLEVFGNTGVMLSVENTGNVLVQPQGELTVADSDGNLVFNAPVKMDSVYAGMTVPLVVGGATVLPEGEYVLSLTLKDEESGITRSIDNQSLSVAYEDQEPAEFLITAEIRSEPNPSDPVYIAVEAEITNNGDAVNSSDFVLDVMRGGELVESFTLVSSLALPPGKTEITHRYIPPTGFESGEWTFVVRLNVVDPSTGAATTVATLEDIPTIVVP